MSRIIDGASRDYAMNTIGRDHFITDGIQLYEAVGILLK